MQANYSKQSQKIHETVLLKEVTEYFAPKPKRKFIDATLGTAGHTLELVKAGDEVLGIDLDPEMVTIASSRLTEGKLPGSFKLVQGNFRRIAEIAKNEGFNEVDGVLFDLGVSNLHFEDEERGFSFVKKDAKLDMRLDPKSQEVTASDLLNVLRADQLRKLFEAVMDPGSALWLSRKIISAREIRPIKTVGDLEEAIRGVRKKPGLNPLTLPMLALRMAVNSELENLSEVLPDAFGLLSKGGRLTIISFHSGEDKLVKSYFKSLEEKGEGRIITEDPIIPTASEIERNPRARSAKLRVCEKI